jgi:hypothetical protein
MKPTDMINSAKLLQHLNHDAMDALEKKNSV